MSVGSSTGVTRLTRAIAPSTSTFSIAGWFLLTSLSITAFPVFYEAERDNADGLFMLCDGDLLPFYLGNQGLLTVSGNLSTATVGEWVYIGMTHDAGDIVGYVSRENAASETVSFTISSSAINQINLMADTNDTYRSGDYVDHVRIWNVVLTQAELDAERNSKTAVRTDGLLSDAPLPNTSTLDGWTLAGAGPYLNNTDSPYIAPDPDATIFGWSVN